MPEDYVDLFTEEDILAVLSEGKKSSALKGLDSDKDSLISSHSERLGVDEVEAKKNLEYFAEEVGQIENSGKTKGGNIPVKGKKATSAKGLYQFVEDSVEPAVNRLEKYIGPKEWTVSARGHKDANKLTRDQQTQLFLADLLEKEGGDKYMKGVMQGNKSAMRMAYRVLHHTDLDDKKTEARAKKYFK